MMIVGKENHSMFEDIMVDLETASLKNNAAIVAIAAVRFDLNERKTDSEFYERVDLRSGQAHGLDLDADTLMWWMKQDRLVRDEAFLYPGSIGLLTAMNVLKTFITSVPESRIWGNGASFDNVILASAFQACSMDPPWNYWNNRCYRTMKYMFSQVPEPPRLLGTEHNALEDAKHQIAHLFKIDEYLENMGI